jgi:hypothetical protein
VRVVTILLLSPAPNPMVSTTNANPVHREGIKKGEFTEIVEGWKKNKIQ